MPIINFHTQSATITRLPEVSSPEYNLEFLKSRIRPVKIMENHRFISSHCMGHDEDRNDTQEKPYQALSESSEFARRWIDPALAQSILAMFEPSLNTVGSIDVEDVVLSPFIDNSPVSPNGCCFELSNECFFDVGQGSFVEEEESLSHEANLSAEEFGVNMNFEEEQIHGSISGFVESHEPNAATSSQITNEQGYATMQRMASNGQDLYLQELNNRTHFLGYQSATHFINPCDIFMPQSHTIDEISSEFDAESATENQTRTESSNETPWSSHSRHEKRHSIKKDTHHFDFFPRLYESLQAESFREGNGFVSEQGPDCSWDADDNLFETENSEAAAIERPSISDEIACDTLSARFYNENCELLEKTHKRQKTQDSLPSLQFESLAMSFFGPPFDKEMSAGQARNLPESDPQSVNTQIHQENARSLNNELPANQLTNSLENTHARYTSSDWEEWLGRVEEQIRITAGPFFIQCPYEGCFKTFQRMYNMKSHIVCHSGGIPVELGYESNFCR